MAAEATSQAQAMKAHSFSECHGVLSCLPVKFDASRVCPFVTMRAVQKSQVAKLVE